MKSAYFSLIVIPFILLQSVNAQREYRVGVSPLVLDIGDIGPGESRVLAFYAVTGGQTEILVRLTSIPGTTTFYDRDAYRHLLINASEEDASSWVQFFDNPVLITPTDDAPPGMPRGASPVTFLLKVPEDADPGWHTVTITPDPVTPPGGAGTTIVTSVSLTLLFHVPGIAVREAKILDVTKDSPGRDNQLVTIHVQNTGTVTIHPRANEIVFFDGDVSIATVTSDSKAIAPGEISELTASVNLQDLDNKLYDVSTRVDYLTGFVSKRAPLSFRSVVLPPPQKVIESPASFPWWIIALGVLIVGIIVYRRR